MSLICSILTWYLKKKPYQEVSSQIKNSSVPTSDDDFLSLFGCNIDSSEKKPLANSIHKKRVYS